MNRADAALTASTWDLEENAEDRGLQESEVSVADDAVDAGIAADGWHPDIDDAEDSLSRVQRCDACHIR